MICVLGLKLIAIMLVNGACKRSEMKKLSSVYERCYMYLDDKNDNDEEVIVEL
jgi:hypothetical protein